MKKLKLDLDRIQVVSFSPETGARRRGTVNGLSDTFVSNDCLSDGCSVIVCDGGSAAGICHTEGFQTCPREVASANPPC